MGAKDKHHTKNKSKPNIFIILLIILLAVNYIWKNADKPLSSMSNSEFSKKTDDVFSELNKETNKFDTNEQLYDELKNNLKITIILPYQPFTDL